MEHQIQSWHRSNALSSKLENIPRIDPITASALVGSVGDAKNFASGRE
jgi:transposase